MTAKKLNLCLVADHYDLEKMQSYAKSKEQLGDYHRQPSLRTVEKLITQDKIDVLVIGTVQGVNQEEFQKVIKQARDKGVTVLAIDSKAANTLFVKNKCYDTSPPVPGKETDLERNVDAHIWDRIYTMATSSHINQKFEGGVSKNGI